MLVGCYYYAWYTNGWLGQTVLPPDKPLLGEYNNTLYGPVIDEHMRMLKRARVDFISISWDPNGFYGHIIDAAVRHGIKTTFFYESLVALKTSPRILTHVVQMKEFVNDDCWLRIDGKPVFMFYVTRTFLNKRIFSDVRRVLGDCYLVGDELFWNPVAPRDVAAFDAVTAYNMYRTDKLRPASSKAENAHFFLDEWKRQMTQHQDDCWKLKVPVWGTAMPGYDDTGVRPSVKHPPIDRLGGEFFRESLRAAMSRDVIMVCSFNEFYESTHIEPTVSDGGLYLDILAARGL